MSRSRSHQSLRARRHQAAEAARAESAAQQPASEVAAAGDKRRSTVLLGWELGRGLYHVRQLLDLAESLAASGHRVVLALRDVVNPWPLLADVPYEVLPAPVFPTRAPAGRAPYLPSYADILGIHGFGEAAMLAATMRVWDHLLALVDPALVVCDHSPMLALTAQQRLPTLMIGDGFTLPPIHLGEFPLVLMNIPRVFPETALVSAVQSVLAARGAAVPETLPAAFANAQRFLAVLPELDPYAQVRQDPYQGPLASLPVPLPLPESRRYYAYLSGEYPAIDVVFQGLASTGASGQAYVRESTAEQRAKWRAMGIDILDQPRPLAEALAEVRVVVHHGGVGTSQEVLAAGRPQLIFPLHLENALNAAAMHRLGVAHYMIDRFPATDIPRGLTELLDLPTFTERATELSAGIAARGPWNARQHLAERCEALIRQG